MRLLALDATLGVCSAAVMRDGAVLAERRPAPGPAALLPALVRDLLAEAGIAPAALEAVAATVGPGSFTGLRATLALAEGLACGAGAARIAVTTGEALAEATGALSGRTLWIAIDARQQNRLYLHAAGVWQAIGFADLPRPAGPVALAGDAAPHAAAWLAARGADVMLTGARQPCAADVARAALRRFGGDLPPLAFRPLYVVTPNVRLPA